jgi:cytosine/adenosine deaminase-related metal-dependent hydrolase
MDIGISGELITSIRKSNGPEITFDDVVVFPGLINSHDHLDFNLFPRLGTPPFADYIEWATTLHKHHKDRINEVLRVPRALRVKWGIVKNLLNGVTMVAEHGTSDIADAPIGLIRKQRVLHSPGFERFWPLKLNWRRGNNTPIVIHAGEGLSSRAHKELNQLIRWNLFRKKLFVVHGVTLTPRQAKQLGALIWCPSSNGFMFDQTAAVDELYANVPVLFGTDSTLTATWNLWQTLRQVSHLLPSEQLFNTLTTSPARAWQLPRHGSLKDGSVADIVIARKKGTGWKAFFETNPVDILLVIRRGRIILFDETIIERLESIVDLKTFSSLRLGDTVKYLVGDYGNIVNEVEKYIPAALAYLQTPVHADH